MRLSLSDQPTIDEFLALDALDLEPVARAGTAVGRARLFRDDPLAALLAHRVEHGFAAADDMVAVKDRRRDAFEQRRQPFLAFDVREFSDVLAAVDQKVEGVIDEVGALPVFQRRLQQLEARLALVVDRHRLAVDQAAGRKLRRGLDQRLELVAPVLAVAGPGGRDAIADGEQQPVPVIFIFVEPAVAGRNFVDQRGELRLLERRRRLARLFLGAPALLAASVRFPHVLAGRDLGHRPAGGDTGHAIVDQRIAIVGFSEIVGDLFQHPRLGLLAGLGL